MIYRLYIDNFRCLQDFDINLAGQRTVLILGQNGTGKSAIADVLSMLQGIARGNNRIGEFLKESDFAFGNTDAPLTIRLSAELDGTMYEYGLTMEMPVYLKQQQAKTESAMEIFEYSCIPLVKTEQLIMDEAVIYKRSDTQVDAPIVKEKISVQGSSAILPDIRSRSSDQNLDRFCNWLASFVILAPLPQLFGSMSVGNTLYPARDLSNFVGWFCGVVEKYPSAYKIIESSLKRAMPEFQDIRINAIDGSSKTIIVRFKSDSGSISLTLDQLADGEKVFFVCAVLLVLNEYHQPLFCFWDEPDNFVSIYEVQGMIHSLTNKFHNRSGQIVMTSHNPETVRRFFDTNTLYLVRKSRMGATTARWLEDVGYRGDLINALIMGDIEDDCQ